MSEPLDPVTAGLVAVLEKVRQRAGLKEDRLVGPNLDTLSGLESVRELVATGTRAPEAIVMAVRAAAGSLEPTSSIVADVSLGLELAPRELTPDPDLYASDLGRRRAALVKHWDRVHELRSAVPAIPKPSVRTLRLEIETEVFNALASVLTDVSGRRVSLPRPVRPEPGEADDGSGRDDTEPRRAAAPAPPPLVRSQATLLLDEFRRIAHALRDALVLETGATGWPHDLRKGSRPLTPWSTSYGVRAMLLLEGSLAPDLKEAVRFLEHASEKGGGYRARAQAKARPEVTAAVLDTLHRVDGKADFTRQLSVVKGQVSGFERTRPFVLTCLLEASVGLGLDPDLTRNLSQALLDARRPYDGIQLWPEKAEEGREAPDASIVHTARAVRALALAQAARPVVLSDERLNAEVEEGVTRAAAWLAVQQDLSNASEIIDRQDPESPNRIEQVYVRHFTAAWVVKALVSAGLSASNPSVGTAVARVWGDYNGPIALWSWSNGDFPVWMTYDAVDALRLAALATTIRPVDLRSHNLDHPARESRARAGFCLRRSANIQPCPDSAWPQASRLDGPLDSVSPAASTGPAPLSAGPAATIPSVDWWITSRCNLACDFCYGPKPTRDPVELRADILAAIEKSTAAAVTFCGGEPLIVREIGLYARRLADSGKRTVLNTNGELLYKRVQQGLDLAFTAVGFSIDGSTELVHRAMRGAKADLGEVLRATQIVADLPEASLKIGTVVSAVNRDDLPSLAALVARLKPDIWRLYQYSTRGVQNSGQQRHRLSEEEFRDLAQAAAERAAPVPTAPSSESQTAGCLIVDPNGNVLQPTSVGYITHGNCLREPIDDIWAKIPSPVSIIQNKRWLSVLTDRPREAVGAGQQANRGLQ